MRYQGGGAARRRTALLPPAVRACGVGAGPERRRKSDRPPHRPRAAPNYPAVLGPHRRPGAKASPPALSIALARSLSQVEVRLGEHLNKNPQ